MWEELRFRIPSWNAFPFFNSLKKCSDASFRLQVEKSLNGEAGLLNGCFNDQNLAKLVVISG